MDFDNMSKEEAKDFAIVNLTYYADENGYYLHIPEGNEDDIYALFAILSEDDLIGDAADESGEHYEEKYGNLCFETERAFKVFFNILIGKVNSL